MRARPMWAAAAGLLLAGCMLRLAPEQGDIIWEGNVLVRGVEDVAEGRTLIVRPGTRVRFAWSDADGDGWGDSGIEVRGRILVLGTKEKPVVFEAEAADAGPGRWGSIYIEKGERSRFAHAFFRGANWAIHSHFTPVRVEHCLFQGNVGAVKFRGTPFEIYGNFFEHNGTAVRYWESDPEIISNVFRGNGTAVFCRLGSEGTLVRGNNFVDSVDYHVKLGELQEKDVDARHNYWGGSDPRAIEARLYHKPDVAYLGRVIVEPFEEGPFPLERAWSGAPLMPARGRRGGGSVPGSGE